MVVPNRPALKISLVLADVDGTLVTADKVLTPRAEAAVGTLHTAGIAFAITSGRPPRGMAMLIEPLALRTPVAGFNGGIFVKPDMTIMEEHVLTADAAKRALEVILQNKMDVWFYSGKDWLVRDPNAPHVAREQWTVKFAPTIVENFEDVLGRAVKIVGVSDDQDLVARCEKAAVRNPTISTSPTRMPTKEPSLQRCQSSSRSRPTRSPRWVTCRMTF
jgi:hydroxymethylpyrimidine pyrophosphatase-like HAD family hydrolase